MELQTDHTLSQFIIHLEAGMACAIHHVIPPAKKMHFFRLLKLTERTQRWPISKKIKHAVNVLGMLDTTEFPNFAIDLRTCLDMGLGVMAAFVDTQRH